MIAEDLRGRGGLGRLHQLQRWRWLHGQSAHQHPRSRLMLSETAACPLQSTLLWALQMWAAMQGAHAISCTSL